MFLRLGRTDLYQISGRQRAIIELILDKDKRHVASFRNHSVSKGHFLHLLTPCVEITGGVGQIPKSIFIAIIYVPKNVLYFRYVAPFRNQSPLTATDFAN